MEREKSLSGTMKWASSGQLLRRKYQIGGSVWRGKGQFSKYGIKMCILRIVKCFDV